jgi:hypothetical protein
MIQSKLSLMLESQKKLFKELNYSNFQELVNVFIILVTIDSQI